MPVPVPSSPLRFPENFLWGAATSPTQIEGHIENEWTDFVAQDGGHCRVACDSYHRYPEDIEWLSKLGINAYRFGIEWSRLQSAPFAPLNRDELIGRFSTPAKDSRRETGRRHLRATIRSTNLSSTPSSAASGGALRHSSG